MYYLRQDKPSTSNAEKRRDAAMKATAPKSTGAEARRDPNPAPKAAVVEPESPAAADARMDGDVQAASLKAASAAGLPFCEECEKARNAGAKAA